MIQKSLFYLDRFRTHGFREVKKVTSDAIVVVWTSRANFSIALSIVIRLFLLDEVLSSSTLSARAEKIVFLSSSFYYISYHYWTDKAMWNKKKESNKMHVLLTKKKQEWLFYIRAINRSVKSNVSSTIQKTSLTMTPRGNRKSFGPLFDPPFQIFAWW